MFRWVEVTINSSKQNANKGKDYDKCHTSDFLPRAVAIPARD